MQLKNYAIGKTPINKVISQIIKLLDLKNDLFWRKYVLFVQEEKKY